VRRDSHDICSVPMLAGSARKRRCLTLPCSRSYHVEDSNDHPPLRNGENGGLLACHDPTARRTEESLQVLSPFDSDESFSNDDTRQFAMKTYY